MTFANSTFRRLFFLALSVLAVCSPPAFAQDQIINVYFKPVEDTELAPLNRAILAALSQPPLQLAGKPFAGVIVIAVNGKIEVTHKRISGTYYDFSVTFTRDGDSLGESAQSCNGDKLSECTDQLVQDVKSVANMGR
jgi:hypothetical protein